jgi:PAS domain S-box-containing protein
MLYVTIVSIIFQFAAGLIALRLIASTSRSMAWVFLSAGIFAMAFRRTHTLYEYFHSGNTPALSYELLGLGISILVFAGIYLIAPLLNDMHTASERLAQNEERYRTVAQYTHDWEYWLSPDGHYLYVSPACEKITGYTQNEFLEDSRLFDRLIHPADQEVVIKKLSSLEKLTKPMRFDCRIIHRDGTTRWIAHNSIPVTNADGLYMGVRASVRDIEHRKNLETKLRISQALYQGLVDNSRSLVLRFNDKGKATFVNSYAIRHLNIPESDILGTGFLEILSRAGHDPQQGTSEHIHNFFNLGESLELEVGIHKSDGSIAWSEWAGSAIRRRLGDVNEYICVGIDVTKRKALDKLKEDVTRIVRHDLKSPLTGIIGISKILQRDENLSPRQAELLKTVEEAATIMLDLVNQSLNLYKLETGTYNFNMEEFDIIRLLKNIIGHIKIGCTSEVPVKITINGDPLDEEDVVLVDAERALIFSLFCNLLKNAFEASNDQPVTLDITQKDKCIVTIHNAGVVPNTIRNNFFEKYVTAGKSSGTGLGTYSAKLIAQQHGGNISMHSSGKKGTVLTTTLPILKK